MTLVLVNTQVSKQAREMRGVQWLSGSQAWLVTMAWGVQTAEWVTLSFAKTKV